MPSPFSNSVFFSLVSEPSANHATVHSIMGGVSGSYFEPQALVDDLPLVVFDFETTGLNVRTSRIIEIGAVKFIGRTEVDRVCLLVNPGQPIGPHITRITGITNEMVHHEPTLDKVLPKLHEIMRGALCVAHNAEFDCGMLRYESSRLGMSCFYTTLCTLKMARSLLSLERRNLDALASHFGLTFTSRHRSLGDILVTAQVFWKILDSHPHLKTLSDFSPFMETMKS